MQRAQVTALMGGGLGSLRLTLTDYLTRRINKYSIKIEYNLYNVLGFSVNLKYNVNIKL